MNVRNISVVLLPAALLAGCSSTDGLLGQDNGRVRLSCAGSLPVAGAPELEGSLSPLAPGAKLEIVKPAPQAPALLTLPDGARGDEFGYNWKEADAGPARPPGVWLCRAGWRYDGSFWQLTQMDAQWVGGEAR